MNDTEPKRIEILRLTSDGSGVGYIDGKATFVPGLLPGEKAEIVIEESKKSWQRGKIKLLLPDHSPNRINPPCTVYEVCGGCQLQHLEYEQTLYWKTEWVKDTLSRIGKIKADVKPTIGMENPWRYRNKVRLHRSANGHWGYHQAKSNSNVVFSDCLLISEQMNEWIRLFDRVLGDRYRGLHTCTWRQNNAGRGLCLVEIDSAIESDAKTYIRRQEKLFRDEGVESFWAVDSKGRIENWFGEDYLAESILGLNFKVSPLAFLQVNPQQTEKLYSLVLEHAELTGKENVWDLYCGIGTITLALAKKSQHVLGIEQNPHAVKDAGLNSELNKIENAKFITGKVEDLINGIHDKPDVIVLDPPRAGANRLVLETIIKVRPERIVYVSCDPGTLARDLGILSQAGYSVGIVQPVDMFPWTQHVECIILMTNCGQKEK